MNRDKSSGPDRLLRFRNRFAYPGAGLLVALTIGGCPQGADLENPERFVPVPPPAAGGSGGTVGGVGGTPPVAGMGGSAGAPAGAGGTAGSAGSAGVAGSGGAVVGCSGFSCDVNDALLKSCGRTGCHSMAAHYANLILTDCTKVAEQMVDKVAVHGDINCAVPPAAFRACTPEELPATCPDNVMLINSANFDSSWVLSKLDPAFVAESCGVAMPAPPGNSAQSGWNEARRTCLIDFFRSLATPQ